MKIRRGFISNSSSSSFCIYGMEVNYKDEDKILKAFGVEDIHDVEKALDQESLIEVYGPENEYIGRSLTTIRDSETGKEFKDTVNRKLSSILGREIKGEFIEEAWSD